ncbi:phage tail tape measure protein [Vibrio parahaemolyticus]|uniref:phage tail tape measure protein n=1 Tax=Vibrio parahaemolyticus TaxID=670 RepID=UPI00061B1C65|nr:phage tail tape measure protein [Vibrio parahaemolyticus]EGQ8456635.1 phage tail tape measure protein [Vibrio parahaemolyticus]EGQ8460293.1 phage tail tape measure protein [Vibrio parahaemolyticus]EGQ9242133.1 phage tail tape measure protein [Vibrio parahaemolyticus]EGQ9405066.1 phage tail tape measure protein [Vibrio parahaemolyticus]EGR0278500.1 phage tail tape measure protein [Vibrio parahaemolyticus]
MLPEALRFQVGLIDQISKPLGNIQRQLNDVTNTYRQGTHTMMAGAAGMVGAGFALQQALMPAIEMDRALGEVKSLGVADDQLKTLAQTAMKFSVEYGKSATEFVAASYDIKSAMGSMTGDELAGVTRSSAILAAATKADTATITNYMGTMYSVFKDQAERIGKDNWAEQVAGMTAKSVEMFKTTGQGMSDAFKGVGALGKTHGVAIQEQMAVLGLLQGSMSGSEAGTRYKAFMNGVVKAQDKLGMAFTDSNGKMLPMFDIMSKLRNQFGDLDSLEIDQIKQAFGSDEAVLLITDLIGKTGDLQSSIRELNNASNLNTAIKMAHSMTDQWERLEQGVFAVRTAFGAALLPALLPVVSTLADGAMEIIRWTELLPNITRYVGYAAIAILGLVAAGGLLTVVAGALSILMSPITLIVTGIGIAIGAVVGLIVYWDKVKAAFGDTAMFKALENGVEMICSSFGFLYQAIEPLFPLFKWIGVAIFEVLKVLAVVGIGVISNLITGGIQFVSYVLTAIVSGVSLVIGVFSNLFQFLSAGWKWVMSGFTDTSGFAFIGDMANSMKEVFSGVFNWITESLAGIWESVKGIIDWIPGFGGDDEATQVKYKSVQSASPRLQVQPGGAAKNIANYQTSSTNYGGVSIYPTYMSSPQDMATELEMAAG